MSPLDRTAQNQGTWFRTPARGLVTIAVAAVLAVAAVPASPGERVSRLSDAAKQAVKPPAEQRPLTGSSKPTIVVVPSVAIVIGTPYPAPYPAPYPYPEPYPEPYGELNPSDLGSSGRSPLHVGTVVAFGSLSSPDFAPSTLYGARVGTSVSQRTLLDLVLLGGRVHLVEGSDIANAFRDPRELGLEGSVRYSITPPYAGLGVAPVAGFRVGRLSWRYLNVIQIEANGQSRDVRDDSIWHYSHYLGLALTFVNTRRLDLGVTALTGWRLYNKESGEGLENDLFLQDRYHELRLETSVGF